MMFKNFLNEDYNTHRINRHRRVNERYYGNSSKRYLFEDKETLITELEKLFKNYNLSNFDSNAAHNEIYQNNLQQNKTNIIHIRIEHKKQKVSVSFYNVKEFKKRDEIKSKLKNICKANDYALTVKDVYLESYASNIATALLKLKPVIDDINNLDNEDLDTIREIISNNSELKDVLDFLCNI